MRNMNARCVSDRCAVLSDVFRIKDISNIDMLYYQIHIFLISFWKLVHVGGIQHCRWWNSWA